MNRLVKTILSKLRSKTKKATAGEEKRERMDKRLKKVMEQNCKQAKNTDLSGAYDILKVGNKQLQLKIKKIQARFSDQEDIFLLEKTHVIYHKRRKTLEDAKMAFPI